MQRQTFLQVVAVFFCLTAVSVAARFEGRQEMVLTGGKIGNVAFPHHKHQSALDDCNRCHGIFPQSKGAIEALKAQNKLGKKQVMDQCKDCHKQMADANKRTGPVKCKGCHVK